VFRQSHRCPNPRHGSTSLAEPGGKGIAIDEPWGSGSLVMNGPLSASAAARHDQRASSIINSPGVEGPNFPSFEAKIAGGFGCALKIGEMSGVF
jgi:hypothetical protein